MKNLIRRWLDLDKKESQARMALTINQVGQPQNSPKNFQSYYARGYQNNVIAFRCIQLISQACAGIEWEVYSKRNGAEPTELPDHPLKKLIDAPNPMMARAQFFEFLVAYHRLTGNTFVEAVGPSPKSPPMELWPVRPDAVKIVPDAKGYPKEYQVVANNVTKTFPVNPVTLKAMMLQIRTFHPTNPWWGMSPLEAAMVALDQNNAGQQWNLALLQNGASPSGVLKVEKTDANPTGALSEAQWTQLRTEIADAYQGAKNAGRPMVLEGGLVWEQIGLSPRDMEFLKSKEVTAIDIANAFGVPPEMLGLGQKTFQNYKEARLSFYEDTVLPLLDLIQTEFNGWLAPMFGPEVYLCYDKDDIEALQIKREAKFTSLKDADFLTVNEKRIAAGYEAAEGGDVFMVDGVAFEKPIDLGAIVPDEVDTGEEPAIGSDAAGTDVQKLALNGAQVTALINIVLQVTSGQLPRESALNMIVAAFNLTPEDAEKILASAGDGFVPKTPEENTGEAPDDGKGWKSFNLLNAAERRTAWKRQSARKSRLERSFERDVAEDLKELARDLERALKSSKDPRAQEYALLKAIDDNTPILERTLKRHIKYSVNDFGQVVFANAKSEFSVHTSRVETKAKNQWDDWATRYIEKRSARAIGDIAGATKRKVQSVVKRLVEQAVIDGQSNEEIASELAGEFASLSKARARTIARTEVQLASNSASIQAVKSLEIPGMVKEWISAKDDRVRTLENTNGDGDREAMDGVETGLDEKFSVPPDTDMDGPGDPSAPPEQIINCRCALGFKSRNNGEL